MRAVAIAATLTLALAGCSAGEQAPVEHTGRAAAPAIVGNWERVTTCHDRVQALQDAGLERFAVSQVVDEGWIPSGRIDPRHPCNGAIPLRHGHFFTEDRAFGSTDSHGNPVDDGTYRVIDEDTIVIEKEFGDVTFDYRIDGGSLFLEPVMPDCTDTGCFAAQWAVAMAYPGLPWKRLG